MELCHDPLLKVTLVKHSFENWLVNSTVTPEGEKSLLQDHPLYVTKRVRDIPFKQMQRNQMLIRLEESKKMGLISYSLSSKAKEQLGIFASLMGRSNIDRQHQAVVGSLMKVFSQGGTMD